MILSRKKSFYCQYAGIKRVLHIWLSAEGRINPETGMVVNLSHLDTILSELKILIQSKTFSSRLGILKQIEVFINKYPILMNSEMSYSVQLGALELRKKKSGILWVWHGYFEFEWSKEKWESKVEWIMGSRPHPVVKKKGSVSALLVQKQSEFSFFYYPMSEYLVLTKNDELAEKIQTRFLVPMM